MPILDSKTGTSAFQRILLSTSMGAILGLQSWRLFVYGFAATLPLYGAAWMLLSYLLVGCSIGLTAGFTVWWKRGLVLALLFNLPTAVGAQAFGLRYATFGVAVIVSGLASGLIVAFLTDTFLPLVRETTHPTSKVRQPPGKFKGTSVRGCGKDSLRERLLEGKACLEDLDGERQRQGDFGFGRLIEERVIWSELLDLELQEIDEQANRIRNASGTGDFSRER